MLMFNFLRIRIFDFLKKRNMDRVYQRGGMWGREQGVADIKAAIGLINSRRYARCLDLGTGRGQYAEEAAPHCGEVLAIDISPEAVERAKERLGHIPNIRFSVANLRTFGSSEPFDLVILGDTLYYLGDLRFPLEFRKAIANIVRLVAPEGRILMVNYISPGRSEKQLREYAALFQAEGMRIEHNDIFSDGPKRWLQTVLVRN
ncbi:MAG: class I SAM-dependent methyltransferase [bacterium]